MQLPPTASQLQRPPEPPTVVDMIIKEINNSSKHHIADLNRQTTDAGAEQRSRHTNQIPHHFKAPNAREPRPCPPDHIIPSPNGLATALHPLQSSLDHPRSTTKSERRS